MKISYGPHGGISPRYRSLGNLKRFEKRYWKCRPRNKFKLGAWEIVQFNARFCRTSEWLDRDPWFPSLGHLPGWYVYI